MDKYSLYNIIKDKLSPKARIKLENQIRYNELTRSRKKYEEDIHVG